MRFFIAIIWISCLLASLSLEREASGQEVHREYLPKWELGLGLFSFRLHDYRGSDQAHNYYWPIPYLIYRGKVVEIENSVVRGNLLDLGRFRFGLSMMGSVRVNSKKNRAREGMPALDPTFEIGPNMSYDFYVADNGKIYSTFGMAIRSAVAAEFFYVKPIGFFTVPYLALSMTPQEKTLGHFVQFSWALMFADQKYHSYFYDVEPQYATSSRPEYHASGGYSGQHATFFASKKLSSFYYFTFFRYDRLKGVSFEESPLVKKRDYVAIGVGLIWYFFKSKEVSEVKYADK